MKSEVCKWRAIERIVLIGFSLDVRPSPGFLVGGADQGLESERQSEVIDPNGGSAGFHDDKVDFFALKDSGEVSWIGARGEEAVLASSVSKKQHMVLNLPRSRARIFMWRPFESLVGGRM